MRNGLKQGDATTLLLFNVVLDYTIRRVQVNQDGLKLNGPQHLLVYSAHVNFYFTAFNLVFVPTVRCLH